MGRLTRSQIEAARARLDGEKLITIREGADALGVPLPTALNYATRGTRGIFLDAIREADGSWHTSAAAVERFKAALTEAEEGATG